MQERTLLTVDSATALLALLAAIALAVFKPKGLTRHGRRKQQVRHPKAEREPAPRIPRWVYLFASIAVTVLLVVRFLTVGGHAH